jgi:hypothetical protein
VFDRSQIGEEDIRSGIWEDSGVGGMGEVDGRDFAAEFG